MKDFFYSISQEPLKVIDKTILYEEYISISISAKNKELDFDISSSKAWTDYINEYLYKNNSKVAFGGYLEVRDIYNRSTHFKDELITDKRNIHLGIDLWCPERTPILAVLSGEIHSFKNNEGFGDYGPTIIIKHSINTVTFYTLYGHLSKKSIENIKVGDKVKEGQIIGESGNHTVNGDYAPHLHFQIIKDLEGNIGDYPGVASVKTINFYKENCPNPNLLLKLPNEI